MARNSLKPTLNQTFRIVHDKSAKGADVEFHTALQRSRRAEEEGRWEEAAEIRFAAVQELVALLPEDESIELDWDDVATREAIVLRHASATDFFLVGDLEMAAAQLEMVLDVDGEDHLEVTPLLGFIYVAMREWDSFDDVLPDLDDKSPEKALLLVWSGFLREGTIPSAHFAALSRYHSAYLKEWCAVAHPADQEYRSAITSERPSKEALARGLWLQTEHLWATESAFLEALMAMR
mgnify:CR=1 FL=1